MIISFIYYVALSKFVDSSFPQYNVHTGVQGGCLAFTLLNGYLKLSKLNAAKFIKTVIDEETRMEIYRGYIVSNFNYCPLVCIFAES